MFHKHKTFTNRLGSVHTIDEVVDEMIKKHNGLNRDTVEAISKLDAKVNRLQSDLAAIHAHYRSELCNDCCHSEVCKLRPNVKYGFECEEKGYELEVMTFEVEPERVEKEETNEGL